MACVSKRKSKKTRKVLGYTIQFYDHNGVKRKLYRFSKESTAVLFGERIDAVVACLKNGDSLDIALSRWVGSLPERIYSSLEKWGLVDKKNRSVTLGELIEVFLTGDMSHGLKPRTLERRGFNGKNLIEFFGADKAITSITEKDAAKYDAYHRAKEAPGTWGRSLTNVKQFFNYAVSVGWIVKNPFSNFKCAGTPDPKRKAFVDNATITKLLQHCANSQERLILCLSRYGGLRLPSELEFMEWSDIDFENNRFLVKTPKKENITNQSRGIFSSRATRMVPMFPELRKAFTEYRADFPENGPERLFSVSEKLPKSLRIGVTRKALFLHFQKAMKSAGINQWPKFFQNMRSTRETELCNMGYSIKDVCAIIGNTPDVAMKHYLQVSSNLFTKASDLVTNQDLELDKKMGTN